LAKVRHPSLVFSVSSFVPGGAHIREIREKAGAKVAVTEAIPNNPERVLVVSGPLDAVSKVCLSLKLLRGAKYA
jgi:hypothetical protein